MLMSLMDPEGVKRRKGHRLKRRVYQNKVRQYNTTLLIVKSYKLHALHFRARFVWHIDGYDKLKPYGCAIHGCIDGYVNFNFYNSTKSS